MEEKKCINLTFEEVNQEKLKELVQIKAGSIKIKIVLSKKDLKSILEQ